MVPGVLDLVVGGDVGILILDVRGLGVDIGVRRADNARCLTMEDALERVMAAVCWRHQEPQGAWSAVL